jgi:hypothetical protein
MLAGPAAVLLGGLAVGGPAPGPERTPEDWIKELGSDSYRKREAATRQLLHMEDAFGALLKARQSADPEVRRRVTLIIAALRGKVEEHAAWELLSEVRPGQVDRLIAQLVKGKGPAARDLDEVLRLARKLTAKASRVRRAEFHILGQVPGDRALVRDCPPAGLWGKRIVVPAVRHDVASLSSCLLVSGGPLRRVNRVYNSVVLVNGDLAGCSTVQRSLVICRGNVGEITSVDGSVVLIKGRLGPVVSAEDSLFLVRQLGHFTSSRNNVFLNHRHVSAAFPEENRFLQPVQQW